MELLFRWKKLSDIVSENVNALEKLSLLLPKKVWIIQKKAFVVVLHKVEDCLSSSSEGAVSKNRNKAMRISEL